MKRYAQCILASCPVPWDEGYHFAEDIFRNHLRHILKHGTKHIYIFGTAGEGYAVSDRQFRQITEVFYDEMKANQAEPMVGIISSWDHPTTKGATPRGMSGYVAQRFRMKK